MPQINWKQEQTKYSVYHIGRLNKKIVAKIYWNDFKSHGDPRNYVGAMTLQHNFEKKYFLDVEDAKITIQSELDQWFKDAGL